MKYGYFYIANKEYVVTSPFTPSPWMNYIGNSDFGGIVKRNRRGTLLTVEYKKSGHEKGLFVAGKKYESGIIPWSLFEGETLKAEIYE